MTRHRTITGFVAVALLAVAVILNYVKRGEVAGTLLESHFSWQIRTFWCPVDMHNHASSGAIGVGTAALIVGPELCSRARWQVVNNP